MSAERRRNVYAELIRRALAERRRQLYWALRRRTSDLRPLYGPANGASPIVLEGIWLLEQLLALPVEPEKKDAQ